MVEWGRLLSGYRGEILGRRFESCPPRYLKNAFPPKARDAFSFIPLVGVKVSRLCFGCLNDWSR